MEWRVASDVGGTFIDIAHIDNRGILSTTKVSSQPEKLRVGRR